MVSGDYSLATVYKYPRKRTNGMLFWEHVVTLGLAPSNWVYYMAPRQVQNDSPIIGSSYVAYRGPHWPRILPSIIHLSRVTRQIFIQSTARG
jgi:hypothetical protein